MTSNQQRDPQRRAIRLPEDIYRQPGTRGLITITTADRRSVFTDATFTNQCIALLKDIGHQMRITVLGYCFMPDHCHLLLRVDDDVGLIDFVSAFKSRTTRIAWAHGHQGSIWQRSFYDHLLRDSEDEGKHLRYLLDNPVRAQLVEGPRDYPFSGSFALDLTAEEWW